MRFYFGVFFLSVLLGLAAAASNWIVQQHDLNNTGSTADTGPVAYNLLTELGSSGPADQCQYQGDSGSHVKSAVLIKNGRVYFPADTYGMYNPKICVYSAGAPEHKLGELSCHLEDGSPYVIEGNTLYALCTDLNPPMYSQKALNAFNLTTFQQMWEMRIWDFENYFGGVSVGNGKVFATGYRNPGGHARLVALSQQEPRILWDREYGVNDGYLRGTPLYHDGKVYAFRGQDVLGQAYYEYFLDVISEGNGDTIYSAPLGYAYEYGITASPILAEGKIFVSSGSRLGYPAHVFSFNQDGTLIWSAPINPYNSVKTPNGVSYWAGRVFTTGGTTDNYGHVLCFIYGFNSSDGEELWHFFIHPSEEGCGRHAPAVSSNGVLYYCASPDHFTAINASTGDELWHRSIGCFDDAPSVYDGLLYAPTRDHWASGFVQVIGPSYPTNQIPRVHIDGPDEMPNDTIFYLNGTASDSDGFVSSISWGTPPGCSVVDAVSDGLYTEYVSSNISVSCSVFGPNEFSLTAVDDDGASGSFEFTVQIFSSVPTLAGFDIECTPDIRHWADGVNRSQQCGIVDCEDTQGNPVDCAGFPAPSWGLEGFGNIVASYGGRRGLSFAAPTVTQGPTPTPEPGDGEAHIDQSGFFWLNTTVPTSGAIKAEILGVEATLPIEAGSYYLQVSPPSATLGYGEQQEFSVACVAGGGGIECPAAISWTLENGLQGTLVPVPYWPYAAADYTAPDEQTSGIVVPYLGVLSDSASVSVQAGPTPIPPLPTQGSAEARVIYLDCPRLTYENETNVTVQCLNESNPCNQQDISLTGAPNRFLGTVGLNGFVYSVETVVDGVYNLLASAEGVGESACTMTRVGQRKTSVPDLNPLAALAVAAAALLLARRAEARRARAG